MSYKKKQRALKATMLASLMLISGLETPTVRAETTSCNEVIKTADAAIDSANKVIDLKTRTITAQEEVIAIQNTHIVALEKDKNSLFSSPWLYFGLGLVTAAFVIKK